MLNHRSDLALREIGVAPKKIAVHLMDGPRNELVVLLPDVSQFSERDDSNQPEVETNPNLLADPFDLSEFYRNEIEKLSTKYDRFHTSYTYLNHLAQLCYLAGDANGAESYLREAIELDPQSFIYEDLGTLLIEQGDNVNAWSSFMKCNLVDSVKVNLRLAQMQVRQGQLENSELYVNRALDIDNRDYSAQMFAGAIHLWKRDWVQAIRSFRVAAETKGDSATLFSNLAAAYWGLGEHDKTVRSLRKAINLDPLNENAVLFFSDVMFLKGSPEKCISPLEVILSYKQENEALWARAARAYYELGAKDAEDNAALRKSLDALTIQAKLKESSGTLNNIGVVQNALGHPHKASRYFARAWATAQDSGEDEDVPFSNFLSTLIKLKEYDEVIHLSSEHLRVRGRNALAKICVHHIVSMEALGRRNEAAREAVRLADSYFTDNEANLELLAHIFYYKTLIEPDQETICRFIPRVKEILDSDPHIPNKLRCRALNNLVFALLKFGDDAQAAKLLGKLSRWVHVDPYATATLGLYNLRKGRIERSETLYRESILLADDSITKERIRQRMCIEFGRYFFGRGDRRQAQRFLNRAMKQKRGFKYARSETQVLLSKLKST